MKISDDYYEETIDIKEILFKVLSHKFLFMVFILVGIVIAFLINTIKTHSYEVYTTILVNDKNNTITTQDLIGIDVYKSSNSINNEIEILKSVSLLKEVFGNLNINVSYFKKGKLNNVELYKNAPFVVSVDSNCYYPINCYFTAKIISNDSIVISNSSGEFLFYNYKLNTGFLESVEKKIFSVKFEDSIKTSVGNFIINRNTLFSSTENYIGTEYLFCFNNFRTNYSEFSNISLSNIDNSSIIKISLRHNSLEKSIDFLNELTTIYLKNELDKKNIVADRTLDFINEHLIEINDSLLSSEQLLRKFQSSKKALQIDYQTEKSLEQADRLQEQLAEIIITKKYYEYIIKTLNYDSIQFDIIVPSLMNINNQILTDQISKLIELQSQKNNLKINSNSENPYITSLNEKIKNSKDVITEYINNETNNIDTKINNINTRINNTFDKINNIPETQRELLKYERKFNIYNNIYTFLLEKKSETLLTKASNTPNNYVIDAANRYNYKVITKKSGNIYLTLLFLSLIIPSLYIFFKYYFNKKILSDKDINGICNYPILAHILKGKSEENAFLDTKSNIAESFRMLRTNLDFAIRDKKSKIILITSSIQGEGKSYVSGNLARSLAINNKKAILLVFDLRKPKLYFDNIHNNFGITDFLINKKDLDEIIHKTGKNNPDIITAGTQPPNPAEIINTENTKKLFDELRKKYDYIIVDTPPIGIIVDGMLLTDYSDANIVIVRYNYTPAKQFENTIKNINSKNINKTYIIPNYMDTNNNQYGYYYKYEYN